MGARNPDRIPIAARRRQCETLEQMRLAGWDILAACGKCGLIMRVDLAILIRLRGRDLSLWNRRARCRRVGCLGFVEFQGRAPGMSMHEALSTPWE